jgi:hypothetical protein
MAVAAVFEWEAAGLDARHSMEYLQLTAQEVNWEMVYGIISTRLLDFSDYGRPSPKQCSFLRRSTRDNLR